MQNEKSVLTPKEINARNQHRETAYVHTMETEKRHELLFVDYGVNFSFFRTIAYLMAHPEGAAPSQIADGFVNFYAFRSANISLRAAIFASYIFCSSSW